jgi:putative solute:sodium symporter small subunit|tara:strand:- start:3379 stop:3645 length:267 start_codon:yes stop_codon:yes gene_type:complete
MQDKKQNDYWKANIRLVSVLLLIWFTVSFGFGILLVDFLDQFHFFGFKLGFWFAQQGSIYIFVILIFVYIHRMKKLDETIRNEKSSED